MAATHGDCTCLIAVRKPPVKWSVLQPRRNRHCTAFGREESGLAAEIAVASPSARRSGLRPRTTPLVFGQGRRSNFNCDHPCFARGPLIGECQFCIILWQGRPFGSPVGQIQWVSFGDHCAAFGSAQGEGRSPSIKPSPMYSAKGIDLCILG